MKSVMITYNQAHTRPVLDILDRLSLRGYTSFENLSGRGSVTGEPHLATHAWPAKNTAIITIIPDDKLPALKEQLRLLDLSAPQQGLRMFAWEICDMY